MSNPARDCGVDTMAFARGFTLKLLEDIPHDQYLHQPIPGANHALWIIGHLAYADDYFLGVFNVRPHRLPEAWHTEMFGQGTTPRNDASFYPTVAEVTGRMTALRDEVVGWVEGLSTEELASPLPEDWRDVGRSLAALMGTIAAHEALHAGQLTLVRRSMGLAPVAG